MHVCCCRNCEPSNDVAPANCSRNPTPPICLHRRICTAGFQGDDGCSVLAVGNAGSCHAIFTMAFGSGSRVDVVVACMSHGCITSHLRAARITPAKIHAFVLHAFGSC